MKIILDEKQPDGAEYKTKILMDADAASALNDLMDTRIRSRLKSYGLPVDDDLEMFELFRAIRIGKARRDKYGPAIMKEIIKIAGIVCLTYFGSKGLGL